MFSIGDTVEIIDFSYSLAMNGKKPLRHNFLFDEFRRTHVQAKVVSIDNHTQRPGPITIVLSLPNYPDVIIITTTDMIRIVKCPHCGK